MDEKIQRLVLKDEDVLVVKIPTAIYDKRGIGLINNYMRNKLHPRKNSIIIIPMEWNLEVIGKEEIKEKISHADIWSLFEEEENV